MKFLRYVIPILILLVQFAGAADDDATSKDKPLTVKQLWERANIIVRIRDVEFIKGTNKTKVYIVEILRGSPTILKMDIFESGREPVIGRIDIQKDRKDNLVEDSTGVLFIREDKKGNCSILPSKKTVFDPESEDMVDSILQTRIILTRKNIKDEVEFIKAASETGKSVRVNELHSLEKRLEELLVKLKKRAIEKAKKKAQEKELKEQKEKQ